MTKLQQIESKLKWAIDTISPNYIRAELAEALSLVRDLIVDENNLASGQVPPLNKQSGESAHPPLTS